MKMRKYTGVLLVFSLVFLVLGYSREGKADLACASEGKKKEQELRKDEVEYKTITAERLLRRIKRGEELVLIDCRPEDEYEAGHIPGAVNVSIDSFTFGKETAVKDSIEKIKESESREIHFVLIDSATGEEYMPQTKILELIASLPENKDEEVIFYCRRPNCTRSPLAARWALALGYRNVFRYEGGRDVWAEKKYPVEKYGISSKQGEDKLNPEYQFLFSK
jgi:rhodanese-related sulfurtransferase